MAGRRRGRTGRGWDAAPPRARRSRSGPGGLPARQPESRAPDLAADQEPDLEPAPDHHEESAPAVDDLAERARQICLRALAVRPRTRAELATALRRHGIPDQVTAAVLDRYSEVGMINDDAFARAWVTSRHHGRGLASRALDRELRHRGVDPQTVSQALSELDEDTELATARELVARKLRSARGDSQAVMRRLVGMLARKGYAPGVAFQVVKEALAAQETTANLAEQLDAAEFIEADDPEAGP